LQCGLASVISLVQHVKPQRKKRIDGRTLKGQRIRQEIRERILTAYIELISSGVPSPTARATAARAGLSLRVIFKHFPDLRALRLASLDRLQAQSRELSSRTLPARASAAKRLERFVQAHTRRLEYVTPIRRTAAMVESVDPDVAARMREVRSGAARDLAESLGDSLNSLSRGERRALIMALHMVCSWPSWETLRSHYQLSPRRARAIMTRVALAVLAQFERSGGARARRGGSRARRASFSVH
jgi:TetR/AcrR family transcriptional regulator, regulator of autoinduction and epiphytic fitness